MIRTFKNKRSAKSDGLLGEGGQDPRSEKREPREGEGEEGIECTSAMRNRPDAPMWGSSSNEGWRARSTHIFGPGAGKESTNQRKTSFPAHASAESLVPSRHRSGEGTDGSSRRGPGDRRSNSGMHKSGHGGTTSRGGVTGAHAGTRAGA